MYLKGLFAVEYQSLLVLLYIIYLWFWPSPLIFLQAHSCKNIVWSSHKIVIKYVEYKIFTIVINWLYSKGKIVSNRHISRMLLYDLWDIVHFTMQLNNRITIVPGYLVYVFFIFYTQYQFHCTQIVSCRHLVTYQTSVLLKNSIANKRLYKISNVVQCLHLI